MPYRVLDNKTAPERKQLPERAPQVLDMLRASPYADC
jgi:hypothetical protein